MFFNASTCTVEGNAHLARCLMRMPLGAWASPTVEVEMLCFFVSLCLKIYQLGSFKATSQEIERLKYVKIERLKY